MKILKLIPVLLLPILCVGSYQCTPQTDISIVGEELSTIDGTCVYNLVEELEVVYTTTIEKELKQETEISLEEFELLANLVMAESENQSFDAQYGVACVVLNRVKSDLFPNTVIEVIYQSKPNRQFSCLYDGRFDFVVKNGGANDSCMEAVQSALEHNDLPDDVLYFTSNGYLVFTDEYCIIDKMYFSKQRVVS